MDDKEANKKSLGEDGMPSDTMASDAMRIRKRFAPGFDHGITRFAHQELPPAIFEKAAKVKLLLLDVDGVLTSGGLIFDENGVETKIFNSQDGYGLACLAAHGVDKGIITGRESRCVEVRSRMLGMRFHKAGPVDKGVFFDEILEESGLTEEECMYIGDDTQDIPVLKRVGLAACPPNAHPLVFEHVDFVTMKKGGKGAVREVCDLLICTHPKVG